MAKCHFFIYFVLIVIYILSEIQEIRCGKRFKPPRKHNPKFIYGIMPIDYQDQDYRDSIENLDQNEDIILTNCVPDPYTKDEVICEVFEKTEYRQNQKIDGSKGKDKLSNIYYKATTRRYYSTTQRPPNSKFENKSKTVETNTVKPELKEGDGNTPMIVFETTTASIQSYEHPLPGEEPPRKVTLKIRKKADNQAVKTEYWPSTYCLAAGDFTQPKGKCFAYITCTGDGVVPTEKECPTGEFFDPFTEKCGKNVSPEKCQVCTSKVDGQDITEGGKKYICKRYHPRSS